MQIQRVAVVGVGQMGLGMALRLCDQRFEVRVHDITPERMRLAEGAGALRCDSAAQAAAGVDALIVAVVDAAQVESVLFGTHGAAAAMAPGALVLLCPTIGPAEVAGFAQRLHATGLCPVDAPMSGGPARAREGRMSLMVACAEPVFAQAQPLLQALANPVFRVGTSPGDGARTKLVNNLLAAINLAGAAECLALAARLGLDPATTLEVVEASSGQSWIGSDRMQRALQGDAGVRAQTALLAKDSALACQAATAAGVEPQLGQLAKQLFAQACAEGLAAQDDASLLAWFTRRA